MRRRASSSNERLSLAHLVSARASNPRARRPGPPPPAGVHSHPPRSPRHPPSRVFARPRARVAPTRRVRPTHSRHFARAPSPSRRRVSSSSTSRARTGASARAGWPRLSHYRRVTTRRSSRRCPLPSSHDPSIVPSMPTPRGRDRPTDPTTRRPIDGCRWMTDRCPRMTIDRSSAVEVEVTM